MSRRLLTPGAALAVLLAVGTWAGRASAKPPDLPLADKNELAPAGDAPAMESLFPMRPSARRTMASCLIFGLHPLLTLAPTGDYVAFDDDDAPEVPAVFAAPPAPEAPHGTIVIGVGVSSDAGLTGSIQIIPTPMPAPKDAPAEPADSVCPWMRRHGAPRQDAPAADFDAAHDVLHNLEMLRQAQSLLEDARDLGRDGRLDDALDCLDMVRTLCPGSRVDDAVRQAAAELFAPLFCGSPDGATGEEEVPVLRKKETGEEREIEQKLKQPVSLQFHEAPLHEVIDQLRSSQGLNIYVDQAALEAEEVSLDRPVTVQLADVSLGATLGLVLKQARLTYVVKDDVVQITTERGARGRMTCTVYDVADLLDGDAHGPEELVKLVTNAVEPRQWCVNGGPGSIDFHPATHALVICQTPDVQEQVADLLAALRRMRDEDAPVPLTPCLPPVDADTPAALDRLLHEEDDFAPTVLPREIEKIGYYEQVKEGIDEAPADPSKGAAKPFRKADGLKDVGCGKDGGAADDGMIDLPHGSFEFGFGSDGSVQMFTQLRRGGAVWHVYYGNGGLSVWASPVAGE